MKKTVRMDVYKCSGCGGDNIHIKYWNMANQVGLALNPETDDIDDIWCDNCKTHVDYEDVLTEKEDVNYNRKMLYRDFIKLLTSKIIEDSIIEEHLEGKSSVKMVDFIEKNKLQYFKFYSEKAIMKGLEAIDEQTNFEYGMENMLTLRNKTLPLKDKIKIIRSVKDMKNFILHYFKVDIDFNTFEELLNNPLYYNSEEMKNMLIYHKQWGVMQII